MNAMQKQRSPISAKKPPVASDSHAEIDAWIRRRMPDLQPIVTRLDELIRQTIPSLQYAVKFQNAFYGLAEQGWIIELVAYDVSVNVVFHGGAAFTPPPPLGTTDRARYIKIKSLQEVETPELKTWLTQAATVPGWK